MLNAVNWDTYWLYVLTEVALSLSPGPAVMLVIACGLAHGARRSTWASLGILSANAIYFLISATALGAVLAASREFFTAVKWVGAAYLVYVGLSAIFGRSSPITVSTAGTRGNAPRDLYFAGLTLQLAAVVDWPTDDVARSRLDHPGVLHPRRLRLACVARAAPCRRRALRALDRSRGRRAGAWRRSAGRQRDGMISMSNC